MKYLEGMEEDIAVRPGMASVGPESMGEGLPTRKSLFLLERERSVFFVGVEVKGYEEGVGKAKQGKGICSGACGSLTTIRGGLTTRHTVHSGQTGYLGRPDRQFLMMLIKLYCFEIIQDLEQQSLNT
jgi:hypothetical protein